MAQKLAAPQERAQARPRAWLSRSGKPAPDDTTATLFPELVLAHYRWLRAEWPFRRPSAVAAEYWPHRQPAPSEDERKRLEDDYRDKLEKFQRQEGSIIAVYWSLAVPSAVALTEKQGARVPWLLWLRRRDARVRLHRASDWLTGREPLVAELLHHCDTLAIKVSEVLRGTAERIAMEWIFSEESYLLGISEQRSRPANKKRDGAPVAEVRMQAETGGNSDPAEGGADARTLVQEASRKRRSRRRRRRATDAAIALSKDELLEIERYYDRAGDRAGRIVYFEGMSIGACLLFGVSLFAGLLLWALGWLNTDSPETHRFLASFAAGGAGAVVSVLSRMRAGSFSIDYEVGRGQMRLLGAVRPLLGAIFGVAVYFALAGGLLQIEIPGEAGSTAASGGKAAESLYFFAFLAFIAGFSERFAHVIVGGAERTIAGTLGDPEAETAARKRSRASRSAADAASAHQQ